MPVIFGVQIFNRIFPCDNICFQTCSRWLRLVGFKYNAMCIFSDTISCYSTLQRIYYFKWNKHVSWPSNGRHNTHHSGTAQHIWCKIYHLYLMLRHQPGSYMFLFASFRRQFPDMPMYCNNYRPLPVHYRRCFVNREQRAETEPSYIAFMWKS